MNLLLSIVALAVGPLLYQACEKRDVVRSALDGLLFVTIAGIVVVYILPESYAVAGLVSLVFFAAGVLVALFVESSTDVGKVNRYSWIVFLGALGLVMHAAMDGIALLPGDHLHVDALDAHNHLDHDEHGEHTTESGLQQLLSHHLALGVILHRIPVGMAIWWALRPHLGTAAAIGALVLIGIATSAAYLLGEPVVELMEVKSVACFQAFVAGTLSHVVVFSSVRRNSDNPATVNNKTAIAERLGVVAGILLIFLVPHAH